MILHLFQHHLIKPLNCIDLFQHVISCIDSKTNVAWSRVDGLRPICVKLDVIDM